MVIKEKIKSVIPQLPVEEINQFIPKNYENY